jgi:hypothetical protein
LAAVLLCVTLCVLLLSGCDVLKGLGLVPDDESDNGGQSEEPGWSGVPVEDELDNPNIKVKFGVDVTLTEPEAVDAAFHELSAFIKKGGLSDPREVIKLGDWIDLDALSVAPYPYGEEYYAGEFSAENADVVPSEQPFPGYEGKSLRLIVVGINSFNVTNDNSPPHVVFQFQNVPVNRRMNKTNTNKDGYAESEMRKYLVKVGDEGGNFLEGLKTAGVPEDVLWAPVRRVANGGSDVTGIDAMTDLLWLPTEREMFGASYSGDYYSSAYETTGNQARLEYYDSDARRIKYIVTSVYLHLYWVSSPSSTSTNCFCVVSYGGYTYPNTDAGNSSVGCAPAFCVR